jgi:hypothetical protein
MDGADEDDEDAGCSRHMSTLFTVQQRIPMLIIHGMLHMLGEWRMTCFVLCGLLTSKDLWFGNFRLMFCYF